MVEFLARDVAFYQQLLVQSLPPRPRNSHKGMFGHVLVVGGGVGMPGAVYLAAQAAARVGAGVVTIATHPDHAAHALPLLPEALVYGIQHRRTLESLLATATVCIVGPGLGEDAWAQELYETVVQTSLPLVVDAQALRFLALNPGHHAHWILTPHPGEASSLLATSVHNIQTSREQAAIDLQKRYGSVAVLKGAETLVNFGEHEGDRCLSGNPGLSSAGMGDVLSGVIAGLLAQGVSLQTSARLGVWLHAHAGDLAVADGGMRGLLASDLMLYLRSLVNP